MKCQMIHPTSKEIVTNSLINYHELWLIIIDQKKKKKKNKSHENLTSIEARISKEEKQE